ncbi:MAG TPA: hypothetical protein VFU23_05825 [Gemmatimonadales bacterium]|nr:hypothetical protein [Gemmatimonadales bacterium]
MAPMVMAAVLFISVGVVLVLRGPVGKALARRIEGKVGADPALAERLEELEHRLAELEQERARMGELEERLDFAERMLAAPQARLKDGAR